MSRKEFHVDKISASNLQKHSLNFTKFSNGTNQEISEASSTIPQKRYDQN